ncbi:hypothetical protein BIW11_01412, partial [Tropilaelaps mercedesae]
RVFERACDRLDNPISRYRRQKNVGETSRSETSDSFRIREPSRWPWPGDLVSPTDTIRDMQEIRQNASMGTKDS